jgi:rare lipoprotein A (peptidoglycan hydrolase)
MASSHRGPADRGAQDAPRYGSGRIIDVTPAGARALGFDGLAPVDVKRLS